MGDVHKFRRPPKNEQQFRGYRPGPVTGAGGAKPSRWRLHGWLKTLLAWAVLIGLATAVWGIGHLAGTA